MEIKASQELVFKTILDQDNFKKALRERVQNAIDSDGKTNQDKKGNLDIILNHYNMFVRDYGIGMNTKEFKNFFLTLGKTTKKDEGFLGKFGIGNGQLFGLGSNLWFSKKKNCKAIFVFLDVRKNGLKLKIFESKDELKEFYDGFNLDLELDGCKYTQEEKGKHSFFNKDSLDLFFREVSKVKTGTISLIEREAYFSDYDLDEELSFIKYLPLIYPNFIINYNSEKLSAKPEDFKEETLCYYQISSGSRGVSIKERGNHVCYLDRYSSINGIFISKNILDLNLTRQSLKDTKRNKKFLNDVHKVITGYITTKAKNTLTVDDKTQIKHLLKTDYEKFKKYKIFKNTSGKFFSIEDLINSSQVYIAGNDSAAADKLNQIGCICITEEDFYFISSYGVNLSKMSFEDKCIKEKLMMKEIEWTLEEYLNKKKHSKYVIRNLAALKLMNRLIFSDQRRIIICKTRKALGYTNGYSYIAINESFILERDYLISLLGIKNILSHEYNHKEDSKGAAHNYNFYESYHDERYRIDKRLAEPIDVKIFDIPSSGQKQAYSYNFYTIKPSKLVELSEIEELRSE